VSEPATGEPIGKSRKETLAIPATMRAAVDERDQLHCRVCGKYLGEQRALHHISFGGSRQGMGGRREHSVDNLITVCWMWGGNCHDLVHSDKGLWLPLLEKTIAAPGVTTMQLRRWEQRRHH
jgi:5-methylcytosine-specific restriction endonuclease McrA